LGIKNKIWIYDYHLAKLITRIDEVKLIENITVDQRHDLIARRLAGGWGWRDSVDDDNELLIFEFSNDVEKWSIETSWVSANKKNEWCNISLRNQNTNSKFHTMKKKIIYQRSILIEAY
jgi:hypothetical protein